MDTNRALAAFSALGQATRLDAFRLLVAAGPDGLSVGEIAQALGQRPNTMSVALSVLAQAGLVASHRAGRSTHYVADPGGVQGVIDFLRQNCDGAANLRDLPTSKPDLDTMTLQSRKNVLFLCTGNSARSLLAETILAEEGAGRFNAYSAGASPKAGPHPYALDLLRGLGHEVGHLRSKSWEEFAGAEAPQMDFVFTVCDRAAAEPCPIWPGQPVSAHWGVPDPVGAEGTEAERRLAFAEAYRMLRNRITAFVNLPMASLDRLSVQHAVEEIGDMDKGPEE